MITLIAIPAEIPFSKGSKWKCPLSKGLLTPKTSTARHRARLLGSCLKISMHPAILFDFQNLKGREGNGMEQFAF